MHENTKCCLNSIEIGRAALRIALTNSRVEENKVKEKLAVSGIRSTAVDFGGEFIPSIVKVIERAVVAAQRQGLVTETHVGAGAVAGAAHEALEQVKTKAVGFNVGGKIGIARAAVETVAENTSQPWAYAVAKPKHKRGERKRNRYHY